MRSDHSSAIDWNERWQAAHRRRRSDRNDREFWNKRAPSFASHARESGYVRDFLGLVRLSPDHTVLDVGCGTGTLAIPLSGRVRRFASIIGLKPWMNQFIVVRPRPRMRPSFGSSQVNGQYSSSRLLPMGLHSTAAMISGVCVLSIYRVMPHDLL